MNKNIKSLIALLLSFVLVISACLPVFATDARAVSGEPAEYSDQYNSGWRDVVCTTLDGTSAESYYTGVYEYEDLSRLSSSDLYNALCALMTNTHTYKSTYNDCHYLAHQTDCVGGDGTTVSYIYSGFAGSQSLWAGSSTGSGWNREHVWPKSLGGQDDKDRTGGADLHHIRPVDGTINSTRNNRKYGYVENGSVAEGGEYTNGVTGGTYNTDYFEPYDNVKGDVARICLYVYARWGSDWGASNITSVFYSVDVLLEWCELDPVDTWEMGRNEVIQRIQGNRNVFIDYPELAWLLFDEEIPADMTTPSGEAKNQAPDDDDTTGGNSGTPTPDPEVPACAHSNKTLQGKISETCGKDGYTGDTVCLDCGVTVLSGSKIPKTGNHSYTMWTLNTEAGTKTRTCTVCGNVDTVNIDAASCSHSFTITRNKLAATCGKEGYSGDVCCMNCGEIITPGTKIAPTGNHEYGELNVITPPTDIDKGLGDQTCAGCGNVSIVIIPANYSDSELTIDILASNLETDQDKILLYLALGAIDKALLEELCK